MPFGDFTLVMEWVMKVQEGTGVKARSHLREPCH